MSLRWLPALTLLFACAPRGSTASTPDATTPDATTSGVVLLDGQADVVFAGGCFWCMEKPFDAVPGVISTTSGYSGGAIASPTYGQVSAHETQHLEALRVVYDPNTVDFATLLQVYWRNIDPTQADGQFCDHGHQYTSAVFVAGAEERQEATSSAAEVAAHLGRAVVTDIRDRVPFWPAEDYHQDFYVKNPAHYARYRLGCGRDARLRELWGETAGH